MYKDSTLTERGVRVLVQSGSSSSSSDIVLVVMAIAVVQIYGVSLILKPLLLML